jgi:hypothetical protein
MKEENVRNVAHGKKKGRLKKLLHEKNMKQILHERRR